MTQAATGDESTCHPPAMSQVPTGDWGRSASLDMHVYSESVPSVSLRKKDQATEFLHTLSLEYF